MADRYNTTSNPEDEYYPGTSVLINLEDISRTAVAFASDVTLSSVEVVSLAVGVT
jgi:hypothetical protein